MRRTRRETAECPVGVGGAPPYPLRGPITALRILGEGIEIALDPNRSEFLVGRDDPPAVDIQLSSPSVPRHHAVIRRRHGALVVHDQGSRNGIGSRSFRDRAVRFERDDEVFLNVGREVRIGDGELMALDDVHRRLVPALTSYCKRGAHTEVDRALTATIDTQILVLITRQATVAADLARVLHDDTERHPYAFTEIVNAPATDDAIDELCTRAGCGTAFLDLTTPRVLPERLAHHLLRSTHYHLWTIVAARSAADVYTSFGLESWCSRRVGLDLVDIEIGAPLRVVD